MVMTVLLTFCSGEGGKGINEYSEKVCAVFNIIHIILLFLCNANIFHFSDDLGRCQ